MKLMKNYSIYLFLTSLVFSACGTREYETSEAKPNSAPQTSVEKKAALPEDPSKVSESTPANGVGTTARAIPLDPAAEASTGTAGDVYTATDITRAHEMREKMQTIVTGGVATGSIISGLGAALIYKWNQSRARKADLKRKGGHQAAGHSHGDSHGDPDQPMSFVKLMTRTAVASTACGLLLGGVAARMTPSELSILRTRAPSLVEPGFNPQTAQTARAAEAPIFFINPTSPWGAFQPQWPPIAPLVPAPESSEEKE